MPYVKFPAKTRCQVNRPGRSPFRALVLATKGDLRKVREIINLNTRAGRANAPRFREGREEMFVDVSQCALEGRAISKGPAYLDMSQFPDPVIKP